MHRKKKKDNKKGIGVSLMYIYQKKVKGVYIDIYIYVTVGVFFRTTAPDDIVVHWEFSD